VPKPGISNNEPQPVCGFFAAGQRHTTKWYFAENKIIVFLTQKFT
jgi:hypothetical protein